MTKRVSTKPIPKSDLAAEFYRLMEMLGRIPSFADVRRDGCYSPTPFMRVWDYHWENIARELAPDGEPIPGLVARLRAEEVATRSWDFQETAAEHRQRLGETQRRVKLLRQALFHRRKGVEGVASLRGKVPDCPWWLADMSIADLEDALCVDPDPGQKLYLPSRDKAPPTPNASRAFRSPYADPFADPEFVQFVVELEGRLQSAEPGTQLRELVEEYE